MDNINITAKDGGATVNIGKDVIHLADHSSITFNTSDIEAFVGYCKEIGEEERKIFFSSDQAALITKTPCRYTEPDAVCAVNKHSFVNLLYKTEDTGFGLPDFEEFLFTLRPYLDDAGRALYSYVRNFSASKITSVKRELDNKGNFNHHVVREKGGASEFEIPEKLTFTIPVLAGNNTIMRPFTFDVYFTWKDTSDGCNVVFKLKNPLLRFDIDQAIRASLEEALSSLNCPKHWGTLKKTEKNDEWAYKLNGLDVPPPTPVNNYR